MPRMKIGEKGHQQAVNKWRHTVEEEYGSVSKFMATIGAKGGRNGKGPDYKGGFGGNKELAKKAGAKGGKASKRGPAKRDAEGNPIRKDGKLYKKMGARKPKVNKRQLALKKQLKELTGQFDKANWFGRRRIKRQIIKICEELHEDK